MGISKTDIFTSEQNKIADVARALGHPARIAILQHLIQQNACICGDLVEVIGLAQSTISQHLKALKQAGIIKGNIEGTSVCYCIDQKKWEEASALINTIFEGNSIGKCCQPKNI